MNKIIALTFFIGTMFGFHTSANTASVSFNGEVTAPSCTMSNGQNINLLIPDISYKDINNSTVTGSGTLKDSSEAIIEFTSCPPSVTRVTLSDTNFVDATQDSGSSYISIPTSGTASGVGIIIRYTSVDGVWIPLNWSQMINVSNSAYWNVDSSTNSTSLKVKAGITKPGSGIGSATPGTYNMGAILTFTYS